MDYFTEANALKAKRLAWHRVVLHDKKDTIMIKKEFHHVTEFFTILFIM